VIASELVSRLVALGVTLTAEADDLVIVGELPDDAIPVVDLLRAPIIAFLTGKRLYAVDGTGRGCVRPDGIFDPRERLPANVRLLAVEGGEWDRISRSAIESFPDLFASDHPKNRRTEMARRAAVGYS
jgi:hypothetical protein